MSDGKNVLPTGWCWATLKDVVKSINYGYTASATEEPIGPRFLRITDIQNGRVNWKSVPYCVYDYAEKYALKNGDIVVARTGATTGKSVLIRDLPEPSVFASYLIRLETLKECSPDYLSRFMQSADYWQQITSVSKGSAQPGANATILSKLRLPVPPLAKQHRIVAKIEALQERSRRARAALAEVGPLLEQFRQSVLAAAFRGDLTADWRIAHPNVEPASELLQRIRAERRRRWEEAELAKYEAKGKKPPKDWKEKYKEPEPVDDSGLPELPDGWCWATWESILSIEDGSFKRGPFGSTLKKSIFVSSGYKVYEQYCPINDDCSYVRYYITPEKHEELKAFAVKARDFLISCSGVTLGRITQVPDDFEEGIINQALLRVRINNEVVNNQFFLILFRSPYFQKQMFDNSTGSAIPNVKGVKDLKAIPVPIPPVVEQLEMLNKLQERLNYIRALEDVSHGSNTAFDQLDQAILAKAFRGASWCHKTPMTNQRQHSWSESERKEHSRQRLQKARRKL